MAITDFFKTLLGRFEQKAPEVRITDSYRHVNTFSKFFDGEKNLGELGPAIDYYLDFGKLRIRSWQSYLENKISKTILDKYLVWIIDKGLKLQAAPDREYLATEGINLSPEQLEKLNRQIEARFRVWSKSKKCSHNKRMTLAKLAKEAYKNAKIGGDVLVVLRYIDGKVTIELIDGAHVSTPFGKFHPSHRIQNGVELNEAGEHIAYHVRKNTRGGWERIEATGSKTGFTRAFLVYGSSYRLDEHRGMPTIAPVLETLKKLDRYSEATVGSAEERQKIAWFITHGVNSDGRSPLADQIIQAVSQDNTQGGTDIPEDYAGNAMADKIAASTNKTVFNLTQDADIKHLESKNELYFKEFYGTNADYICAAIGIPPNVAFSLYTDSFSASRASTKDWDHSMLVERDDFTDQFYQPIYNFFQFIEILEGKISAPGYLQAYFDQNDGILTAYQVCRFTGPLFPHVDPVKEVTAERAKLGPKGAELPLTTAEQATEALNTGDFQANIEQFSEEIKDADSLGLGAEVENVAPAEVEESDED